MPENRHQMMLSMQYSNSNGNIHNSYHSRRYLKSHYHLNQQTMKNFGRNRRLSGNFGSESHLISVPTAFKVQFFSKDLN